MSGHGTNGGYEKRDANIGALGLLIGGLAALTVAGMLIAWMVFRGLDRGHEAAQPPPPPLARERPAAPPEPRLQADPRLDLGALRRAEQQQLSSYGWVDRDAGIARIPLDRAIEILAERGLPAAEQAPPARTEQEGAGPR